MPDACIRALSTVHTTMMLNGARVFRSTGCQPSNKQFEGLNLFPESASDISLYRLSSHVEQAQEWVVLLSNKASCCLLLLSPRARLDSCQSCRLQRAAGKSSHVKALACRIHQGDTESERQSSSKQRGTLPRVVGEALSTTTLYVGGRRLLLGTSTSCPQRP